MEHGTEQTLSIIIWDKERDGYFKTSFQFVKPLSRDYLERLFIHLALYFMDISYNQNPAKEGFFIEIKCQNVGL